MDEKTLLKFIEQIIVGQDKRKIELSLGELATVLEKNNEKTTFINMVRALAKVSPEAQELGARGLAFASITKEDLEDAIIRGNHRLLQQKEISRQEGGKYV